MAKNKPIIIQDLVSDDFDFASLKNNIILRSGTIKGKVDDSSDYTNLQSEEALDHKNNSKLIIQKGESLITGSIGATNPIEEIQIAGGAYFTAASLVKAKKIYFTGRGVFRLKNTLVGTVDGDGFGNGLLVVEENTTIGGAYWSNKCSI